MTDRPAAVLGTYTDLQFKKGLEVVRITVEIPMSEAADFIEKFGAPHAVTPVPVLLARQAPVRGPENGPDAVVTAGAPPEDAAQGQGKPHRSFKDLKRSAQAALLCQSNDFLDWLMDTCPKHITAPNETDSTVIADYILKSRLDILSKRELDSDPAAAGRWDALLTDFDTRGYAHK